MNLYVHCNFELCMYTMITMLISFLSFVFWFGNLIYFTIPFFFESYNINTFNNWKIDWSNWIESDWIGLDCIEYDRTSIGNCISRVNLERLDERLVCFCVRISRIIVIDIKMATGKLLIKKSAAVWWTFQVPIENDCDQQNCDRFIHI